MRLLHVFLIGITLGYGLCSCSDSIYNNPQKAEDVW